MSIERTPQDREQFRKDMARLRESKPSHSPGEGIRPVCGCKGWAYNEIEYCPLHAAAPRTLALLKELLPSEGLDCDLCGVDSQEGPEHDGACPIPAARALIAEVEG